MLFCMPKKPGFWPGFKGLVVLWVGAAWVDQRLLAKI
jgi:hypothetical protein